MLQTEVEEKINKNVLCSVTFSRKSCLLWDNLERYCSAGLDTDDNI